MEVEKGCPNCGANTKLVVRVNKQTKHKFLGCPNWPECTHTEELPEAMRMELEGQPRLL